MVADLFRQAALTPRALSHIGVTLGPGSFTGLRVGLSFAKGLAVGLGLSLSGVGTLAALNAHADLAEFIPLAAIHGGRGDIYVQRGADTAQTVTMADLSAFAATNPFNVLTGPAANEVRAAFPDTDIFAQNWPSLATLAALTLIEGHDDVTPMYMRGADALASTRGIITLEPAS